MKMTIVGCRPYDFEDKETGRKVSGLSLFYTAPSPDVKGNVASKLSVKSDHDLYHRLLGLNYTKPIEADAIFELVPGSSKAVLIDVQIKSAS